MLDPETIDSIVAKGVEPVKIADDGPAAPRNAFDLHLDEMELAGRTYFGLLAEAQQAALGRTFDLQSALLDASRGLAEASAETGVWFVEHWMSAVRQRQEASLRFAAQSARILESLLSIQAK